MGPSQRNAARVNATVQPAKHGSGRASRRWFLLTGAILSARAHFSNSSLADARRRLCGAASNSTIAGPLLASLSKRRVASVFRLRLLGEARATRSVLHVSRCWTSLNEMGRLSTRCGDADGGSRRLRLAPTGTGVCDNRLHERALCSVRVRRDPPAPPFIPLFLRWMPICTESFSRVYSPCERHGRSTRRRGAEDNVVGV